MVAAGEFIEHANVFGNCYGTARRFLDQAREHGRDLLLDVDIQGASQVKEEIANTVSVFVQPPDTHELEWRLRSRGSDVEEVIQRRLAMSSQEIENYRKYDYVLVNERLEECADELRKIVHSERKKRSS